MDIEDKLTTAEQVELHAARANDRERRSKTAPIHVNSESDDIMALRVHFCQLEREIQLILPDSDRRTQLLIDLENVAHATYRAIYRKDEADG